jgi:hypothetical protein
MQDNHQPQPKDDLEFEFVWGTIWDSIYTEIFVREDASEAGWHLATSKILEVLDDPCEEGDDLFNQVRSVVANAQVDAWALMKIEASNEGLGPINDVIGQAVDEILGIFFPATCCVEGCGHYAGDDPTAHQIWDVWSSQPDDELSPVKTIASTLGLTNAEVAVVVYPPDSYGAWADDHEPMRPWFPTEDVTLFDTEDLTPRPMEKAVLVKLGFVSAQGTEFMLVEVLDPLDDGSGWVGALDSIPEFLPMEPGDLVTFGHRHILEVHYSDQSGRSPTDDNRCRLWTGETDEEGHGLFETDEGETMLAGEWALLNTEGGQDKIPGWVVYWNCARPNCVRPSHLEQVPPEEVPLREAALAARKLKAAEEVVMVDGEFMHATHDKFWMPDLDDRENLPIGESVKLIFADGNASERMWVEVVAQEEDGSYHGVLMNTPVYLPLEPGRPLHFEAKNVIEVHCEVHHG